MMWLWRVYAIIVSVVTYVLSPLRELGGFKVFVIVLMVLLLSDFDFVLKRVIKRRTLFPLAV